VTVSAWFLPVLVSDARTLSPTLRSLIGTALPEASRTRVAAAKLLPPVVGHGDSSSPPPVPASSAGASAAVPPASAASLASAMSAAASLALQSSRPGMGMTEPMMNSEPFSAAPAWALVVPVPSRHAQDLFAGWRQLIAALGEVPQALVWAQGGAWRESSVSADMSARAASSYRPSSHIANSPPGIDIILRRAASPTPEIPQASNSRSFETCSSEPSSNLRLRRPSLNATHSVAPSRLSRRMGPKSTASPSGSSSLAAPLGPR
jgi:hypothetical protein